jgi:hypothetical protein
MHTAQRDRQVLLCDGIGALTAHLIASAIIETGNLENPRATPARSMAVRRYILLGFKTNLHDILSGRIRRRPRQQNYAE